MCLARCGRWRRRRAGRAEPAGRELIATLLLRSGRLHKRPGEPRAALIPRRRSGRCRVRPRSLEAGPRDVVWVCACRAPRPPEPRVVAGNPRAPAPSTPGRTWRRRGPPSRRVRSKQKCLTPRAGPPPPSQSRPLLFFSPPFASQLLEESEPGAGAPTWAVYPLPRLGDSPVSVLRLLSHSQSPQSLSVRGIKDCNIDNELL